MHEPVGHCVLIALLFMLVSYYFIHKFVYKYVKSKNSPFYKKSEAVKLETISFQCYWVLRRLEDSTGLLSSDGWVCECLQCYLRSRLGKKYTWKHDESVKHLHKFTLGHAGTRSSSVMSSITEFLFGRTPQESGMIF